GEYQLWPADQYQQENPQVTDQTGKYSFLAPVGTYYITASADGYKPYKGDTFELGQNSAVHTNIQLQSKLSWAQLDWKTIVIILLAGLVIYGIYTRRKRATWAAKWL